MIIMDAISTNNWYILNIQNIICNKWLWKSEWSTIFYIYNHVKLDLCFLGVGIFYSGTSQKGVSIALIVCTTIVTQLNACFAATKKYLEGSFEIV